MSARTGDGTFDRRTATVPAPRGLCGARGRLRFLDRGEAHVLGEDLLMQGAQRGGRLEAELIVQDRTGPREHLQRVRLPPGLVQGRHQQPGESLVGRVRADDRVEVGDDVGGPAERQQQLRAFGQRRQPQLPEPGRLHRRPRLVGEVRERLATPSGQRRAVQPGGLDVGTVVLAVAAGAGSADTAREGLHVDRLGCDVHPVPDTVPGDGRVRSSQRAPQLRHPQLQRVRRVGRQGLAPQPVDERVRRDHPAGREQQQRQQRPLRRPGKSQGLPVGGDAQRAEQPELDMGRAESVGHRHLLPATAAGPRAGIGSAPPAAASTPGP